MPDQEQAARIAAMRARRGQAPINIEVTAPAQAVEVVGGEDPGQRGTHRRGLGRPGRTERGVVATPRL